jgi:hypothetical protein
MARKRLYITRFGGDLAIVRDWMGIILVRVRIQNLL